jgi:hypothetical protein
MALAHKDRDGEWVVPCELTISRYDLEGSIDSIKTALDGVRAQAVAMGMKGEGSVDISVTDGFYDGYELEIRYYFSRYETDKEREQREGKEARLKDEAKAKRKAAAQLRKMKTDPEFAEFERLKAKFGV